MFAKLSCTRFGELLHFLLGPEVKAAGRARLDARGFQALRDAVHAQRALEDFTCRRAELRNIERAAAHAVAAADAMVLLKIHNAVDVLHDGAVRGTGDQASGLLTVHALIFT